MLTVNLSSWKDRLTDILKDDGYSAANRHTYEYSGNISRFWSDVYVSTWKEFAENALKTPEVSAELEQKAMEETRRGAMIWVPKIVWVAQRI
ncbi:hypothetical protein GMORB2_7066 [Geosmithia morbida]|uniref:Uncharacterized protein n=1 Tax=Geosmithia morbida TaxID=1094350 RepID=A0A9P4YXC6_9HYPO|nr:uncharacterized protein GMORB2_7066 [Geosmithia morbida]KAF4122759.1 hypothetical protein GMORB2_7066 [Geosmithia morbida]